MRLPIALPAWLQGWVEQSTVNHECRLVPPSLNRSGYGWDHREKGVDGVRCGLSHSAEAGGFYLATLACSHFVPFVLFVVYRFLGSLPSVSRRGKLALPWPTAAITEVSTEGGTWVSFRSIGNACEKGRDMSGNTLRCTGLAPEGHDEDNHLNCLYSSNLRYQNRIVSNVALSGNRILPPIFIGIYLRKSRGSVNFCIVLEYVFKSFI